MARYLLYRVLFALITLWAVVTVAFFLARAAPGGPFDGERRLPPEVEANLRAAYHLDESPIRQYVRYVRMLSRGDLGPSFRQKDFSVNELIANGLPISLAVGGLALVVALIAGVTAGTFAAMARDGPRDRVLVTAATFFLALPPIIVGTAPGADVRGATRLVAGGWIRKPGTLRAAGDCPVAALCGRVYALEPR